MQLYKYGFKYIIKVVLYYIIWVLLIPMSNIIFHEIWVCFMIHLILTFMCLGQSGSQLLWIGLLVLYSYHKWI